MRRRNDGSVLNESMAEKDLRIERPKCNVSAKEKKTRGKQDRMYYAIQRNRTLCLLIVVLIGRNQDNKLKSVNMISRMDGSVK